MTTFEENAEQFGVGAPAEDYSEEIYAPVRLSNSTRRMMTPTEMVQERVNTFSPAGRMIREQEAARQKELLEIDRMEDEAYAREIEKRAKAAAWNDKVMTQQHASRVMESLVDLNPADPDFLTKKDSLVGQYPMALLDDRVKGVLDSKSSIFEIARQERDKAAEVAAAQARARDNTDYNIAKQREENDRVRAVSDESEMLQNVAKLPAEARAAFEAARKEGKPLYEAMGAANDVASQFISQKDYGLALRDVSSRMTQNTQLMRELKSIPSYSETAAEDRQRLMDAIEANNLAIQEAQVTFIEPYRQRKGADTTANNPGSTVPQGDSPRSGASPAPDALTPTIDPKKIRAATEWIRANPDDPRAKKLQEQLKGMTRGSL